MSNSVMSNAIDWICVAQMSDATQQIEYNIVETHDKGRKNKKELIVN